ncbi:MAG TPA: hypothetical protein VF170_02520, partial [Planctomycetaceae bacterium]
MTIFPPCEQAGHGRAGRAGPAGRAEAFRRGERPASLPSIIPHITARRAAATRARAERPGGKGVLAMLVLSRLRDETIVI